MTAECGNGEARAETITRQRLAKSMFRGKERAWKNQRVAPRLTRYVTADENENHRYN
jgi:hypothetical protein